MRFVTISQNSGSAEIKIAKEVAKLLNIAYIPRRNQSAASLCEIYAAEYFLMITSTGPVLCNGENRQHRFHLSMGELRVLGLERGQTDYLVEAVGPTVESILDCTVGLGADSMVLSYFYKNASVVGLEAVPELAYITNYGCRHFIHKNKAITEALRRLRIAAISYETFLKWCPDNAFEVVYFDPMFATPVDSSPQFLALRGITLEKPLTEDFFSEACRVAAKKVIIKERSFSPIFDNLGITEKVGGKYSRITYGVFHT